MKKQLEESIAFLSKMVITPGLSDKQKIEYYKIIGLLQGILLSGILS